jgi:predicted nucleic acid-binding protein
MLVSTMIAKTFRAQSTNYLRQEKSLRDLSASWAAGSSLAARERAQASGASRARRHYILTLEVGVLQGGIAGTLVLDAQGIVRLAEADKSVFAWARRTDALGGDIVTAASTLAEILRGGARDARIHRILRRVTVVEIDKSVGRKAGELLGATGMSGYRCTVDALLAAVALAQRRPVILLTSDPDDMGRLTEEPDRRKRDRIAVIKL